MPELPEVETTRRGIAPHIQDQPVAEVIVRERRLRWPVPDGLEKTLTGQSFSTIGRRGKYLLLSMPHGTLMIHLGMSGSLRIVTTETAPDQPPSKHDHLDIVFAAGHCLRFHDPRKFGSIHWLSDTPEDHPLLADLGPEPLSPLFTGDYLYERARRRRLAIKHFIMDSHLVVGVGNIYANEALFMAGIDPRRQAGRISRERMTRLAGAVRAILSRAIEVGGTTLRDFVGGDGKPGYFSQSLLVYGRGGEDCRHCGATLVEERQGQRSTVYCRHCQR